MREVFRSSEIHSGQDFDEVVVKALVPEEGDLTSQPAIRMNFTFRYPSGREEKESMHMTRAAAERLQSALGTALMMTSASPGHRLVSTEGIDGFPSTYEKEIDPNA